METQDPSAVRASRPQEVASHLRKLLLGLAPGERLPSETALSAQLQVSRTTVRDGLARLERDGLIVRQHGLGTFKARPSQALHAPLNQVQPIPDLIRAAGYEVRVAPWSRRRAPGDAATLQDLGLSQETELTFVDLLYLANGAPAVQVTYMLAPKVDQAVTDWTGFEPTRGMIDFLRPYLREPLASTSTCISAVAADAPTARVLHVSVGSPLLRFVTLGLTASGEALYRNVSFQSGHLLDVHISRPIAGL